MSGPRRGQIYWADLEPVVGSEQGGLRPVLIVQNDVGNEYSRQTITVPITSNTNVARYPFAVGLPDETLSKPSVVNCSQIRSIDRQRLVRGPVTKLDAATMRAVDRALATSLGLPKPR